MENAVQKSISNNPKYDNVSGQVPKETTGLTKHKGLVKNYTYGSVGNKLET